MNVSKRVGVKFPKLSMVVWKGVCNGLYQIPRMGGSITYIVSIRLDEYALRIAPFVSHPSYRLHLSVARYLSSPALMDYNDTTQACLPARIVLGDAPIPFRVCPWSV